MDIFSAERRLEMSYEIAKTFWKHRDTYPNYPNTKRRRLIDVNFIIDNAKQMDSVIDIGCSDGYLLIVLRELSKVTTFYGYDISEHMLKKLDSRWGSGEGLFTRECDFTIFNDFPATDLAVSMGMFPYIFEEEHMYSILNGIKSNELIVRVPCTLKELDEYINTFSEDLGSTYSAIYRTVDSYTKMFRKFYQNLIVTRAYPDLIESNYGTKNYYFICRNKI